MSKDARFQGRLTNEDKESLGMKDQEFLDHCLMLNKLGLIRKMIKQIEKAQSEALKNLKVG